MVDERLTPVSVVPADLTPGRVEAFSDGVFAIALTLLVLSLQVPASTTDAQLPHALHELLPNVFGYVLSAFVIGLYWLGHHRLFALVRRVDEALLVLNLVLLVLVAALPFP